MDRGIILGFRQKVGFESIRLVFYKSDATFSRKPGFPDYCVFAKFHHAQGGKGFYFFEITMWEKLVFL